MNNYSKAEHSYGVTRNMRYIPQYLMAPESEQNVVDVDVGCKQLLLSSKEKMESRYTQNMERMQFKVKPDSPPTRGLFDKYYAEKEKLRKMESAKILIPKCPKCKNIPPTGDNFWVTVHGYPKESERKVLRFFSCIGTVSESIHGGNNWLHLRYEHLVDQMNALKYDRCNILEEPIQVGVFSTCPEDIGIQCKSKGNVVRQLSKSKTCPFTSAVIDISDMNVIESGNISRTYVQASASTWDNLKAGVCNYLFGF